MLSVNNSVFPSFMKFFNEEWEQPKQFAHTVPSVNVKETESAYVLELAAPGMKKEDFQLSIDKNLLTIKSETKNEKEEEEDNYKRREFSYQSFKRSFTIDPHKIEVDEVSAAYDAGILTITLQKKDKKEEAKRLIEVV